MLECRDVVTLFQMIAKNISWRIEHGLRRDAGSSEERGSHRDALGKIDGGYFTRSVADPPSNVTSRSPRPRGNDRRKAASIPSGILFHYTAGCGSDLSGVYLSNDSAEPSFSVDRDGPIYEYAPVDVADMARVRSQSGFTSGSNTRVPASCELTDVQLLASAAFRRRSSTHVARRFRFTIPLHKIAGPALLPGFHDHRGRDAFDVEPERHTDHLYRWSWKRYLPRSRRISDDRSRLR